MFYKLKQLLLCVDSKRLRYGLLSLSRSSSWVQKWLQQWATPAILGCRVGINNINVFYQELLGNNRLLVGFILMMGVGPLFYEAHHLFDENVKLEGFYYRNPYFWFFTQREEFLFIFSGTGFFLMSPQKWAWRYILVLAVAFNVTEIIYQSFFIDSWDDFYTTPSWQYIVLSPVIVFVLYKIINYMVYRKYHLKDGTVARVTGILRTPGLTTEQRMKYLETLVDEMQNFNART